MSVYSGVIWYTSYKASQLAGRSPDRRIHVVADAAYAAGELAACLPG
jgi:hypothetical protein